MGCRLRLGAHGGKRPPPVVGLDSVEEHRKLLSMMVAMAMRIERAEGRAGQDHEGSEVMIEWFGFQNLVVVLLGGIVGVLYHIGTTLDAWRDEWRDQCERELDAREVDSWSVPPFPGEITRR